MGRRRYKKVASFGEAFGEQVAHFQLQQKVSDGQAQDGCCKSFGLSKPLIFKVF